MTDRIPLKDKTFLKINDENYRITTYRANINKVSDIRLLISEKYNDKDKKWNKIHLISTNNKLFSHIKSDGV